MVILLVPQQWCRSGQSTQRRRECLAKGYSQQGHHSEHYLTEEVEGATGGKGSDSVWGERYPMPSGHGVRAPALAI